MSGRNSAVSALHAQQQRIDLIANNIANVNTPGFKPSRGEFADLIYQEVAGGNAADIDVEIGTGMRMAAVTRSEAQGALQFTGQPTDLAISGAGFFQVRAVDGTVAYTRNGAFQVDGGGGLVGIGGAMLEPRISVPQGAKDITISDTGRVEARMGDGSRREIGQIQLALFANPNGLSAVGGGMFVPTPASGAAQLQNPGSAGAGRLAQGALEASATDLSAEMTELMQATRGFQFMSRVIQSSSELSSIVNEMRR